MKFVIIVAVFVAAAVVKGDVTDTYLEMSKDAIMKCAKDNGFTEQTLREIYEKDMQMGADASTCLLACTMKELGSLKDSKLNLQALDDFIKTAHSKTPENIPVLQKASAECVEKVKSISDECKMAYSYVKCFMDKH